LQEWSINEGHPDKLCDQVLGTIFEACSTVDPLFNVVCESGTEDSMVTVAGEVTTHAKLDCDMGKLEGARGMEPQCWQDFEMLEQSIKDETNYGNEEIEEAKAEAAAFDASSSAVLLTNVMQSEVCMGDALRGHCAEPSQLKLALNSVGIFVKCVIDVKAEAAAFDASSGAVLLKNIMQSEDCMGDALRGQVVEPSQLELTLISDGIMQTVGCMGDALRGQGKNQSQLQSATVRIMDEIIEKMRSAGTFPNVLDVSSFRASLCRAL
jgi:hypothetical protein